LYLSLSVNVFNSQVLIDLTNNSKLAFGPLLIIALGLLFAAFRKSESYDFMKTEQVVLIGIVLFISANGSILINVLSLIILISSPKIFEGNRAGVVR
jgi:predicted membrane protein